MVENTYRGRSAVSCGLAVVRHGYVIKAIFVIN